MSAMRANALLPRPYAFLQPLQILLMVDQVPSWILGGGCGESGGKSNKHYPRCQPTLHQPPIKLRQGRFCPLGTSRADIQAHTHG